MGWYTIMGYTSRATSAIPFLSKWRKDGKEARGSLSAEADLISSSIAFFFSRIYKYTTNIHWYRNGSQLLVFERKRNIHRKKNLKGRNFIEASGVLFNLFTSLRLALFSLLSLEWLLGSPIDSIAAELSNSPYV
jgi:hypothetical protein